MFIHHSDLAPSKESGVLSGKNEKYITQHATEVDLGKEDGSRTSSR